MRPLPAMLIAPSTLAALAALTAAPAFASDDDLLATSIDLGRVPLLLAQIDGRVCGEPGCGRANDDAPRTVATLSTDLEAAIWEYNGLRTRLCAAAKLPDRTCGRPYVPSWLARPSKKPITAATLTARVDAFSAEVYPLWEAACVGAAAGECAME